MHKLRLRKVIEIFYSFIINNDLLSTHSITVFGARYTALNRKDTEIIFGGGRGSDANRKPNELKRKAVTDAREEKNMVLKGAKQETLFRLGGKEKPNTLGIECKLFEK